MKRVLILEPYYGGSHRFFLEGLQANIAASYTLFTLPARKWKMRMQLSALWCIEKITALPLAERRFDAVLCSSFIDVAVLRALLIKVKGWNQAARICIYFHENQFHYPERSADTTNFHFASINFHSALAADKIAFNSVYNAETFFAGCQKYLGTAAEMGIPGTTETLKRKSCILFPAIDFSAIDTLDKAKDSGPPVVIWNHRWEHDKNPAVFFQTMTDVSDQGIDFRLIILGKSFSKSPQCFLEAKSTFRDKIIHFGYADSYRQYVSLLGRGDVVVSTALHEFFGIAVIEAVRAGCYPLLPDRLAYTELFEKEFLFQDNELRGTLVQQLLHGSRLSPSSARSLTDRFSWTTLVAEYSQWLFEESGENAEDSLKEHVLPRASQH